MSAVVEVEAPAKVNLWLRILAREESGFHSLESLFCAIALADVVRVEAVGEGVALEVIGGGELGPPEANLVVRAARRFLAEVGAGDDGLRLRLTKRIPAAAGLGGGSSDAAATLRALNRLYDLPLAEARLLQLGIELGSDVPFFLGGSALALGWGRGERLLALPPLPAAEVVVAHPGAPMPTGAAFAEVARQRGGGYRPTANRLRLEDLQSWDAVAAVAANDFEGVARATVPRVGEALQALRKAGASIALLAGSGASVFGIFTDASGAGIAADRLRGLGCTVWSTHTVTALPDVGTPRAGTG